MMAFFGFCYLSYVMMLLTVVVIAVIIYKITKRYLYAGVFLILIFLPSIFLPLIENDEYDKNKDSWPYYKVMKSVDDVRQRQDYTFVQANDKDFDRFAFFMRLRELYKKNSEISYDQIRGEFPARRDFPLRLPSLIISGEPDQRSFKKYVRLDYVIKKSNCTLRGIDVFDISTGRYLGISREICKRELLGLPYVSYLPYAKTFFPINERLCSNVANKRWVVHEVFPMLKN